MKKQVILTLLLGLIVLVGCSEDYAEYEAPGEINDTSWIIGFDQNKSKEDAYLINIDTYISFLDLSQGYIDHEWIIEEGNSFLKEGFTRNDSLPLFIKNDETSTTDTKAHVLFRKKGLNSVRLYNTFSKPVTRETSLGTFTSKQVGNLHVVDTSFVFDVFGHIKPAFRILQDGNVILEVSEDEIPSLDNEDEWPVVEVKAATSLTYEDLTTEGRPNSRRWDVADGSPITSNGVISNIKFFRLGTFNAGTIRATRSNIGRAYPTAEAEKIIPLKVKVVQSDLPFEINGSITEQENQVLRFQVTGVIADFVGQESFFTVNVKNDGFDQDIPVSQVRISESDATYLELSLSQPIYNSDEITVDYSGGSIKSLDDRELEDFANPVKVIPYFEGNVLPGNSWASFELDGGNHTNAFASSKYWIGASNRNLFGEGNEVYSRVDNQAYAGVASMKYQIPDVTAIPTVNLFGFGIADGPGGLKAGSYLVSYWVFIDPSTTLKTFRMEFQNPVSNQVYFDISNVEKGKWVKVFADAPVVIPADVPSTDTKGRRTTLRILQDDNPGVSGPQLMYFDDLNLIELEER